MKENYVNSKMALVVSGISSPQLLLWKPLIQNLIQHELKIVYHLGSSLSEEDNEVIQGIGKETLRVEKLDSDTLPDSTEWILFSNTADKISYIDPKLNHVNRACFWGGVTSQNLGKQTERAIDLNINALLCDLMPSEIQQSLNPDCFSFFVERSSFLPPEIPSSEVEASPFNEESLFIFNQDEEQPLPFSSEIYAKVFSSSNSFRVVDLNRLPIERWLPLCIPSKSCLKVVVDVTYRPLLHFLDRICSKREIEFQTLGVRGALTPERSLLNESKNSARWLRNLNPIKEFSFREKTRSILKANPDLQTKETVDSSKGKHTFNTIASFFLSKEKNQAQELASQISAYYSAKKPIFEPCDNGRHISSPLSYLLREAQHANMLRSSLDFFASHSDPDSSKAFQDLVETCLRLTSEQQLCSANFHALGRLKSSSPRVFLEAFINIFRENPEVPASTKLATYVQHNLQLLKWNEKTRKTYYEQLLGLPLPITISPSLLLGANKFDALNLIIQDSKKLGLKGIAGRAVYYKIHETPGQGSEEAERLEDLCRKEIANGLDNISTHLSLATLDIIYQVNKRPEKVLEAPRPNCDIKTQLLLRHELSLLYLTVDNPDGAAFALDAGNHPFAGKTNYTHISAIVISILLNEVETAETLAHNFLDQGITSLWEEQLHSIYHFALFHALLFRKTKNKIAETHARKLMEETLIPRDDAFRDLIDKIENTGDIPKGSPLFVLAESLEQQLPPLQNSPSTRSA